MKTYHRIFLVATLALVLTALVSPWAAAWWTYFVNGHPGWQHLTYPFGRIFDRIFMVLSIGSFLLLRKFIRFGSLRDLGLPRSADVNAKLATGALLAIGSTVLLVGAMTAAGAFTPYFRLAMPVAVARLSGAMFAAVCAGTVEEIFFRGILFGGLRESLGRFGGYFVASFVFAAIHFIRPASEAVLERADGLAGIRHLANSFNLFLDPAAIASGLTGLFLIALVLCYAFERTGTLYLSIGLHAGWIFALKSIRVFGDFIREDLGWIFGSSDPKIVSGPATWIGVLVVGMAVHQLCRKRATQTTITA